MSASRSVPAEDMVPGWSLMACILPPEQVELPRRCLHAVLRPVALPARGQSTGLAADLLPDPAPDVGPSRSGAPDSQVAGRRRRAATGKATPTPTA